MNKALVFLILFSIACSEQKAYEFDSVPCEANAEIKNTNLRTVFKPCREYIYRARYWSTDFELVSDEYIWMMATGKAWAYDESQDEIAIQYSTDTSNLNEIRKHSLNPEIDHLWREGTVTGIVEDQNSTWMHPFRQNQYTFTEVAPFPQVNFPMEPGAEWTGGLNIYEGWGIWSDSRINSTYQVIGYETIELEYGMLDAWHVKSVGTAPFGTSIHDFWYHMEYGFIKMVINNYAGQVLTFELVEVK